MILSSEPLIKIKSFIKSKTLTFEECPFNFKLKVPLLTFQISIDCASLEQDANLPSGKTANELIIPDFSLKIRIILKSL